METAYLDDFVVEDNYGEFQENPNDKHLNVRFFMKSLLDRGKSEEAGRPVYKEREFVSIANMGDRLSTYVGPVNPSHRLRFRARYDAFKNKQDQVLEGTPLENWQFVTESQRDELRFFKIFTVEQLAATPDSAVGKVSGIRALKNKALKFVKSQESAAPAMRLQVELDKRDKAIADMQQQIAILLKKVGEDTSIVE